MDKTTILYALSTLAQTCAALAALIGAVGLYRLQSLRQTLDDLYDDIYVRLARPTITHDEVLARARQQSADDPVIADLRRRFDALTPVIRRSRRGLYIFELWQLAAILISLVGFLYLDDLEHWRYTSGGLLVLTLGSVITPGYCALAWFRDNRP